MYLSEYPISPGKHRSGKGTQGRLLVVMGATLGWTGVLPSVYYLMSTSLGYWVVCTAWCLLPVVYCLMSTSLGLLPGVYCLVSTI